MQKASGWQMGQFPGLPIAPKHKSFCNTCLNQPCNAHLSNTHKHWKNIQYRQTHNEKGCGHAATLFRI